MGMNIYLWGFLMKNNEMIKKCSEIWNKIEILYLTKKQWCRLW